MEQQNKSFRLPKEFATKWLAALRSGEYTQINGQLIMYQTSYDIENRKEFVEACDTKQCCCLGVAAVMLGATAEEIGDRSMPGSVSEIVMERIKYPGEINRRDYTDPSTPLENILAALNDGVSTDCINSFVTEYPNLVFRVKPDDTINIKPEEPDPEADQEFWDLYDDWTPQQAYYTFEDIAQFIEDNVEFYEEEVVVEDEGL